LNGTPPERREAEFEVRKQPMGGYRYTVRNGNISKEPKPDLPKPDPKDVAEWEAWWAAFNVRGSARAPQQEDGLCTPVAGAT